MIRAALLLLAAALAVLVAAELGGGPAGTEPAPVRTAAGQPGALLPEPGPDRGVEAAVVLSRPVFDPRRRPPGAAPAVRPATAPVHAPLPRVSGILVSGADRSAIFAVPGAPRPVVAREGGRVGAFTVQAIASGQVTLLGPDGTNVLRPSFDTAPRPARPVTPPPPPPIAPGPPSIDEP